MLAKHLHFHADEGLDPLFLLGLFVVRRSQHGDPASTQIIPVQIPHVAVPRDQQPPLLMTELNNRRVEYVTSHSPFGIPEPVIKAFDVESRLPKPNRDRLGRETLVEK